MRKTKLRAGNKRIPVNIIEGDGRIEFAFPYNPSLMEEIKLMAGARYHGYDDTNPRKTWSVRDCTRNRFQLNYLEGGNPYAPYDIPLVNFTPERKCLYHHQGGISSHVLTRHYCIEAAEMGTGKTLALIEAMEQSGVNDWWWVAPKSAKAAVELEFLRWRSFVTPRFLTYEQLVKILKNWEPTDKTPQGVVFDESSRLKNPGAQRSQAAFHLAESIRKEYGTTGFVVLLSGSPAPGSPVDWWHQCEIARPGFLREGDHWKLRNKLAVVAERESITGGRYPELVTWKDNSNKCEICGQEKDHDNHSDDPGDEPSEVGEVHEFKPCLNEVQRLYKRMNGLVHVVLKKDCLDLPAKQYRRIQCEMNPEVIRAAQLIGATAKTAIQGLTLLRELSDGFQYREVVKEIKDCSCQGSGGAKKDRSWITKDNPLTGQQSDCPKCFGSGKVKVVVTETIEVPCPKEDVLAELLEEHEDYRRLVVYAGFTGSIDRVVKVTKKYSWKYVCVDGRGWRSDLGVSDAKDMLRVFQDDRDLRKICFIGHPGSAGMGLTLTASPSVVYYSNDFNAESRIQSEDRIHRPGCRGANIIDIIHLPSDDYVLENLKKKRDLQALTLGDITRIMEYQGERTT